MAQSLLFNKDKEKTLKAYQKNINPKGGVEVKRNSLFVMAIFLVFGLLALFFVNPSVALERSLNVLAYSEAAEEDEAAQEYSFEEEEKIPEGREHEQQMNSEEENQISDDEQWHQYDEEDEDRGYYHEVITPYEDSEAGKISDDGEDEESSDSIPETDDEE